MLTVLAEAASWPVILFLENVIVCSENVTLALGYLPTGVAECDQIKFESMENEVIIIKTAHTPIPWANSSPIITRK